LPGRILPRKDHEPTDPWQGIGEAMAHVSRSFVVAAFWLMAGWGSIANGPSMWPRSEFALAHTPIDDPHLDDSMLVLPDLRTLPPSALEIHLGPHGRVLRLANTVWNSGTGALELAGEVSPADRRVSVSQILTRLDGSSHVKFVGEFVWHPGHNHWHINDFALYQVWSLTPLGDLERVVAGGAKVSYCLIDTDVVSPDLPGFVAGRTYRGCGRDRQGLSVGWGDTYAPYLDGQDIELADLPDGLYALVSTVNPVARLMEANYRNNTGVVYIRLVGSRVNILMPRDLAKEVCLSHGKC